MTAPSYPPGTGGVASGHLLHSVLAPIPIGAVVMAFGADIALMVTTEPFWGKAAKWLLLGALVSGILTAVVAIIDMIGISRAQTTSIGVGHRIGDALVLSVTGVNYLLRTDGDAGSGYGIILTAAAVLLVMLSGWLGGTLTVHRGIDVPGNPGLGEVDKPEFLSGGHPDMDGAESLRPLGPSLSAISTVPPPQPSDRAC